jgi:GrpB-like predicted nucleotidyltransferase (UPF0157 family)
MQDSLEVLAYDPAWPLHFDTERNRLRAALGQLALRIDHNGSTAVPGLAAKPVIDIQISVRRLVPIDAYRVPLQTLGYHHVPHADDAFCPFFHQPPTWPHTHHVHVVEAGGEEETRTLAFRDYLRDHAAVRAAYAALKAQLAPQFSGRAFESRQAYADAKGEFIERIIKSALAEGYPCDTSSV